MDNPMFYCEYADQVGGVFNFDKTEVIPFNHWKRDMEWLVMIIPFLKIGVSITVKAYSASEAAQKAYEIYLKEEVHE